VNRGKSLILAITATGAVFAATPACAQTFTGSTTAWVMERLTIANTINLQFGAILPGTTAGTVTVTGAGVRSTTGGATAAGGDVAAAEWVGFGSRNQHVRISFGAQSIQITKVGGTETMLVDTFTIQALAANGLTPIGAGPGAPRYRITPASGLFLFTVGARLNVAANQVAGNYSGTYTITVAYQ
jgi:hypothetical protein